MSEKMEAISILQLCDEHVELRAAANKIVAIVNQDAPLDWGELAPLRLSLSRLITRHLENEDRYMGKAMWSHGGVPSENLQRWYAERQQFRADYSEHLRIWTLPEIGAHWRAYRKAVLERVTAGEALMRLEESTIYPSATR
jgi:hypothetical protein